MFLNMVIERNPQLIIEAAKLHRDGVIEPNTYVLDVDSIYENAKLINDTALKYNVNLYYMTKQFGRNPIISKIIEKAGIDKAVAVDFDEAKVLYDNGLNIGHIGHLVQVPKNNIKLSLLMKPEVITCFSYEKAKEISDSAKELGITQDILLRVIDENDVIYPGQEGGIYLGKLKETVHHILKLENIKIAGITSFPCFLYDYEKKEITPTHNVYTLLKAKEILHEMDIEIWQVNGPSATCCSSIPLLNKYGITHGEPGHALLGTTPLHAYTKQPEKPAIVYVSEISHVNNGKAYCYGGGFYPRSNVKYALVSNNPEDILDRIFDVEELPPESIDYYGTILLNNRKVNVGDTVIYSFRTQIFVTRAKVALLEGLSSGKPKLTYIFDSKGNLLKDLRKKDNK
ncbi:YhfX family PLP-dependent enzyme [Thermoanaerobacter siderophilus]|uniref:Putative amino acid racemase n=1 Tax=Thermoanaerobacter siderophilus SR4 TaxID=880478 RepID=I8R1X5_9THEO|nr:YhfX family PLP-dependent enzyme [Thermoanaerobacter siderophilus]EIV99379.1 putative amino acid racemase [Thermoanaerobacter siderophilus SR4]